MQFYTSTNTTLKQNWHLRHAYPEGLFWQRFEASLFSQCFPDCFGTELTEQTVSVREADCWRWNKPSSLTGSRGMKRVWLWGCSFTFPECSSWLPVTHSRSDSLSQTARALFFKVTSHFQRETKQWHNSQEAVSTSRSSSEYETHRESNTVCNII